MESFDAIVVGLGAHGSAATAELARRGLRVLGLERFGRDETRGSSGGRSRMIRLAHFENPAYVPLARASLERWLRLEQESGLSILTRSAGLYAGPADSAVVIGSAAAARDQGVAFDVLDGEEIARRWPVFAPREDVVAVLEAEAGILRADHGNAAHRVVAERAGASLRFRTRVVDWRPAGGAGFEVALEDGTHLGAALLVLAAGPWTSWFVPDLEIPLVVERQPVLWFEPPPAVVAQADTDAGRERLPMWLWSTDDGTFYGFPPDADLGLKVAHHHSGVLVDPEDVDREVDPADEARIRAFLRTHMPAVDGGVRASTICLYTNTPDDEFVIDRHPAGPGVAFASACSGHGYKFAPVVGEILADLVTTGSTSWPIESFRADRFRDGAATSPGRLPRSEAAEAVPLQPATETPGSEG